MHMSVADKNGGPNHVKAWRSFRGMTLAQLAEHVGTNANMIGYLEAGDRGLSAKWLRKLAAALDTTPGLLLDHDPNTLNDDLIAYLVKASALQKRQLGQIAKALLKDNEAD
jgi:transcriptional regulator with XRE-family HTH domain